MSFVLLSSQFNNGLQSYSALLLQALRHVSEVAPLTITDIRSQLEATQIQPFDDAAFVDYLTQLYSLELDYTLLNATEKTLLNVIREYISPPEQYKCCGTDTPTGVNTLVAANERVGSATFEYELQVVFDNEVTCDVDTVECTITPLGGAPAPLVSPVICEFAFCTDVKAYFSHLWIDFASDPSGQSYDISLDIKDSGGFTIASFVEPLIIA